MHAETQSADLDTFLIPVPEKTFAYWTMLNTEVLWNKALKDNNARGITRWLWSLTTEGQHDADKGLAKFNRWLQCSIELTEKELLTLCFGQCHGLWMFLDQTSFIKLCLLIQKLKNLLLLARWGHTCVMCRINVNAMVRCGCWDPDLYTLRQHILLGRLIQWWSFTGLLPEYPDANELKKISQMWQEMNQHHKTTCLELRCDIEDKYRGSSIIQGMVAHMHKRYGPLWVSEDCTYQTYPPPSLYSLLKLVLVPYTDATSALAIIMYFVLDVSNMKCKGDLLESFCHTFSIPSSFSQRIYGLWLLDHGFVSNSLGKLLHPETCSAWSSCHGYAVLRTLLRQGQRQAALKYLYYTKPAIENTQDARLYVDVLLQNNHVAEAQILLRQCQPGNEHLLKRFICGCENLSLRGDVLASVCEDILHLRLPERPNSNKSDRINRRNLGDKVAGNKVVVEGLAPSPLSALLYQCLFNGSLTPGNFLRLFRETVNELNSSKNLKRMMVVWPKYLEKAKENRNTSESPETFYQLPVSPKPVELHKLQPESELLQNARMAHVSPAVVSSGSTSPHSMESACLFICSPSPPSAKRRQEETSDEECDSLSDNHIASQDVTQCCSHITLTVGVTPKAMFIKSSRQENEDELVISEKNSIDDMVREPPFESIRAEDESEQDSVESSEGVYCQDSICDEASGSSSFLDLKPLRRALPYPPAEKNLKSFCYDLQDAMDQPEILTSCAHSEYTQDLLEQLHEQNFAPKDGEPIQPSSLSSVRNSTLVMACNPVRQSSHPHKTKDKTPSEARNAGIKEVVCFRTTSDRVGDLKLGSWWKEALETRRASTGLLPAIEQVPAVTKEKRNSLVLGWPQSHGLIRDSKQEVTPVRKEDSSSRKDKGKRNKRAKQS